MTATRRGLTVLTAMTLAAVAGAPATAMTRAKSSPSAPVTLAPPAGWFHSANGKVVAQSEADLTAAVPSGPRARIIRVKRGKKGVNALVKRITTAERSDPELVDGPTDLASSSADLAGIVITFSETAKGVRLVRRYVIVTAPNRAPSLVVLEAPEAQWSGALDTLVTIPQR
jgi:hypothetical protein